MPWSASRAVRAWPGLYGGWMRSRPGGAAVAGAGPHGERRVGGDGPVGAEDDGGSGFPQVAAAPGVRGTLLAEPPGPVVGVVGAGEVTAVGRLHRRDDNELRDPAQGVVGDRLDVLDRVPYASVLRARRGLHRVEDVPHGGVPDGRGGGGDTGPVEFADDAGEGRGVGPEGVRGLAVAVGAAASTVSARRSAGDFRIRSRCPPDVMNPMLLSTQPIDNYAGPQHRPHSRRGTPWPYA
jgi:hypothetical protein